MNQPITEVGVAFRLPTTPSMRNTIPQQEVVFPEHTDTALDIEGAENLLSISQGSATSADDIDELPEGSGVRTPLARGRLEND